MNSNRIRKLIEETLAQETADPFMECPACFWEGLSPEMFKARQQIYQRAYELARAKVESRTQPSSDDYSI